MAISLLPENPAGWAQHRYEDLFAIAREEREALQLKALQLRFERLRDHGKRCLQPTWIHGMSSAS